MSGTAPDASSSEWRQVTILHCDIVESTHIVGHSDGEGFRSLIHEFVALCGEVVSNASGHMAGFTGDGIEAYFGHPSATENAPADALLAAVEIHERISSLRLPMDENRPLQVRIGVATGRVVTERPEKAFLGKDALAYGTPPHLAARLEAAAMPGETFVDSTTRALAASEFVFEQIGGFQFKGIEEDQVVWRVVGHQPSATRFHSKLQSLTPFVGRTEELRSLTECRQRAFDGRGCVMLVRGDPGIGKSRLVYEAIRASSAASGMVLFSGQCSPRFSSTPLYPILYAIEQRCLVRAGDSPATKRAKVAGFLSTELGLSDTTRSILLFMMESGTRAMPDMQGSEVKLRQATADLVDSLIRASSKAPVMLLIEDFHWADDTSGDLVRQLIDKVENHRVLAVLTSRDEHPELSGKPGVRTTHLDRLSDSQTDELITTLAAEHPLQPRSRASIRQRADGNPLYVEEITRTLVEQLQGVESQLLEASAPSSLQNLLFERLDRLGVAKRVAQVAATIGREFRFEMLREVEYADRVDELETGIGMLVDRGIVQRDSTRAERCYFFHHALLQEAAYESQLKARRRVVHARIARFLLGNRRRRDRLRPELLAFHFQESGDVVRAFRYWIKAGDVALKAGATVEAVRVMENARTLLGRLDDDARCLALRLRYYLLLGKALNASVGARSDEAVNAFRQAGKICERLGQRYVPKRIHALDSEFGIIYNSGDLDGSLGPARAMIEVGQDQGDEVGRICGFQSVGMALFMKGEFSAARKYLEDAVRDPDRVAGGINSYPSLALMFLAYTCYILDERQWALELGRRSIASGRRESPYSQIVSLGNSCYLHIFDDDLESVERSCHEMIELAERSGQLIWLKRGLLLRNWLVANKDLDRAALRHAASLVDELLRASEEIDMTLLLCLLAETEAKLGLDREAVEHFEKSIEIAHRNQEKYYLPEIHRKYAAFLATRNGDGAAAEHYRQARELAARQGAVAWLERVPVSGVSP